MPQPNPVKLAAYQNFFNWTHLPENFGILDKLPSSWHFNSVNFETGRGTLALEPLLEAMPENLIQDLEKIDSLSSDEQDRVLRDFKNLRAGDIVLERLAQIRQLVETEAVTPDDVAFLGGEWGAYSHYGDRRLFEAIELLSESVMQKKKIQIRDQVLSLLPSDTPADIVEALEDNQISPDLFRPEQEKELRKAYAKEPKVEGLRYPIYLPTHIRYAEEGLTDAMVAIDEAQANPGELGKLRAAHLGNLTAINSVRISEKDPPKKYFWSLLGFFMAPKMEKQGFRPSYARAKESLENWANALKFNYPSVERVAARKISQWIETASLSRETPFSGSEIGITESARVAKPFKRLETPVSSAIWRLFQSFDESGSPFERENFLRAFRSVDPLLLGIRQNFDRLLIYAIAEEVPEELIPYLEDFMDASESIKRRVVAELSRARFNAKPAVLAWLEQTENQILAEEAEPGFVKNVAYTLPGFLIFGGLGSPVHAAILAVKTAIKNSPKYGKKAPEDPS